MTRTSFLFALALAATASAASNSGFDPEKLAQVPVRLSGFVEKETISGPVTLVSRHGGAPVIHTAGYQDIAAKKPMRPDTIFQIMSMTKPITSVGIMILADEGRLDVGDPVEKYLPDFRKLWVIDKDDDKTRVLKRPSRPITIRDLLTHTSGMGGVLPDRARGMEIFYRMDRSLADEVLIYSQNPLEFDPGASYQYSNTGMATAGRIIEVLSGQPYEKFIEERILKPLGMKDSFYFPPDAKKDRIAMVYRKADGKLAEAGAKTPGGDPRLYRKGAKYPCPECGLFSTATDLAAFYQMMLNRGTYKGKKILSSAAVERMTTNHTPNLPQSRGLGWQVVIGEKDSAQFKSPGAFFHGGAFGTHGWVDPKKDLVGVFLIQRTGGSGSAEMNAFLATVNAALVD
jgi:CubicO group peptidase (beta-lactamase class C family)